MHETYAQRCEREDEADRLHLVQLAERYEALNRKSNADRLSDVMDRLFALRDDGIITGWSLKFPERP